MASLRSIRLPTALEYRDALQAPDLAFLDRELRGGRPVLDRLGLPRASSGSFATVFHVQCLLRQFAVRCFLRSTDGMHERYRLISGALGSAPAIAGRWTVGFEYVSDGIRVGGAVYPIIKMEWVDGTQLHTYVGANLGRPDKIYGLAGSFLAMMCDLRESGLAHGDLQHGNILVTRAGGLQLVDYDCMFTPWMAGQRAPEVGHPNYQHPQRAAEHFDASLDDFSSWVIYVSLVALAYAPGLWSRFDGGDECLFLRKKDFLHPESSEALGAMRAAISEPKFQEMLDAFIWILGRDPGGVLPLPPIGRPRPVTADHPASDPGRDGRGGTPNWMVPGDPLAAGVGDHRAAQLQEWRGGLAGPSRPSEESAGDTSDSSPAVVPASYEQPLFPPAPVAWPSVARPSVALPSDAPPPAPAPGGADPVAVARASAGHHSPVASPPSVNARHTSPVLEKWTIVVAALAVGCVIAVLILELFVLYSIMNPM